MVSFVWITGQVIFSIAITMLYISVMYCIWSI